MIPRSFIDELIARADIVELIGSRVQLKKAGREYKACCPFHNEKTASFWVSPEKQFYHCFGCEAHGTALGFLIEHDRLPFPEAVELLASTLGLEVPREGGNGSPVRRPDEALYEMMSRIAAFYGEMLGKDARALAYAQRRGLSVETIERFGIGYAPNSWNEVLRRFGGAEEGRRALVELGLIIERDSAHGREGERHYDRFRDRLMFPIRDARGRTIAFGGRVLEQGEPKYLNSPETVLFHKGRELYALYEARRSRSNLKRLLIVEGYMDAVRLHQFGLQYAVATLGTATTPEHLKRIFQVVSEVVFAFDGDRAGRTAAWRALQHAVSEAREGREIRFLFLPEGHDPDSLVGEEGSEAFERRIAAALPLSEYLIRELSAQADLTHADGRARFAELARPIWLKLPQGVFRELLLGQLASVVGIGPARLEELWDGAAPSTIATSEPNRPTGAAVRVSAGRGSLVRQAIARLVMFPGIALQVSGAEREALDACDEPGIPLLRELLDDLREQPAQNSAQVIERWSGRAGSDSLEKLLQREAIVADAGVAAGELRAALGKLAERVVERRLQALEAKSRSFRLEADEIQEFQSLISLKGPRGPRSA